MDSIIREGRVFILAEIAQAYEGSKEVLVDICDRACRAGVDGVMFQVVAADEIATPGYTHYALFKGLEMAENAWRAAIDTIHQHGKKAVGEVFGPATASLMQALQIDMIKIHASDMNNRSLLSHIAGFRIPVLLSVGGARESEIETAVRLLTEGGSPEVVLMHGYQSCPTAIADSHLFKIKALKRRFGLPVGYSDHIAGCVQDDFQQANQLANYLPLIAIGAGAQLVEKHIILDRSKAWEDYESALDASEFMPFVTLIRQLETAAGKDDLHCNAAEEAYRTAARKCLVAARELKAGTVLAERDIALKRIADPETGMVEINTMLGRELKVDLEKDATINQTVVC